MENQSDPSEKTSEPQKRLPARERIRERMRAERLERIKRQEIESDPVEGLAKLLADLPPEVIMENLVEEDGIFYVKRPYK